MKPVKEMSIKEIKEEILSLEDRAKVIEATWLDVIYMAQLLDRYCDIMKKDSNETI
jgi:hypothetical protein